MNLKELREAAIKEQQAILAKAKAESRELTADEQKSFDELQTKIDALTSQIKELEATKSLEDAETKAIEAERARVMEINSLCRQFSMDGAEYIKAGKSVDEVKSLVLAELAKNTQPVSTGRGAEVTVSEEDKFRNAATDALLMRGGIHLDKPAEGANELRGMSLRDMALETLGKSARMGNEELLSELARQFYNPSAAFPSIMDNTINKAYREGYNMVQTTFEEFVSEGSLSDFKTTRHEYIAGPAGEFLRVPENGELKHDTPTDELLPSRKLETYGRQFTMSRQAFINDDIGFLTSIPARYARAAKTTINKQVYEILVNNATIYDGTPLFSAGHKNLVTKTTGAPSSPAIQAMIIGLATQKNQFGEDIMIRPATIIVPVGYGFQVQSIFQSATIQTTDNTQAVNPLYQYRSQIKVVEDPTINTLAAKAGLAGVPWFIAGDKNDCAGIQVDYLNGQKIPTIRRSEVPGTLGFVWDIFLDWGITATDFRGIIRNDGAALDISL